MTAGEVIRDARIRAGLSLRAHAARAGTSHSALAAYESGRKTPRSNTLERIVRSAGFALDVDLSLRADTGGDRSAKGRELYDALELASRFPARHELCLAYPPFRRVA